MVYGGPLLDVKTGRLAAKLLNDRSVDYLTRFQSTTR